MSTDPLRQKFPKAAACRQFGYDVVAANLVTTEQSPQIAIFTGFLIGFSLGTAAARIVPDWTREADEELMAFEEAKWGDSTLKAKLGSIQDVHLLQRLAERIARGEE